MAIFLTTYSSYPGPPTLRRSREGAPSGEPLLPRAVRMVGLLSRVLDPLTACGYQGLSS